MPTLATIKYVADLVVRQAVADAASQGRPLREVLAERYPFQGEVSSEQIWLEALNRHGLEAIAPPRRPPSTGTAPETRQTLSGELP